MMRGGVVVMKFSEPENKSTVVNRPIFHTGFHKTGTTYLQRSFWPHIEEYNYSLARSSQIKNILLNPYAGFFEAEKARREIETLCGGPFICSSEEFSGNPRLGGFNGVAVMESYRRIARAFPEAVIVVTVREQKEMIKSLYVQYVKMGGTKSLRELLEPHNRLRMLNPGFSYEYYCYDRFLDQIHELWPRDRIFVYNYDDMKSNIDGFLKRMADDLQLTCRLASAETSKSNVSMGLWSLYMSRILNRFSADLVLEKRYLCHIPGLYRITRNLMKWADRYLPGNPKIRTEALLGVEKNKEIDAYYADSNRRLFERYGIRIESDRTRSMEGE